MVFKPLKNRSGNAASSDWTYTVGRRGSMKKLLFALRSLGLLLGTAAYAQTIWMFLSR